MFGCITHPLTPKKLDTRVKPAHDGQFLYSDGIPFPVTPDLIRGPDQRAKPDKYQPFRRLWNPGSRIKSGMTLNLTSVVNQHA